MVTAAATACLSRLTGEDGGAGGLQAVEAAEVALVLGMTAAVVTLSSGTGPVVIWGENPMSASLVDLQLTLGEGPVIDAGAGTSIVLEPSLRDVPLTRWAAFTTEAETLGVRAVFAFPLRLGVISIGALMLHRDTVGPMTADQQGDGLVIADAITLTLMIDELNPSSPTSALGAGGLDPADVSAVVHQATGMISVQLDISVADALVRLRAHAFSSARPIRAIATDVVQRRLRFHA